MLASSLSVLEEMSVPQVFFAGASKSNKVPSRISWLSKLKLCRVRQITAEPALPYTIVFQAV